jgi:uncharacterized protein (TIGR02611 family)
VSAAARRSLRVDIVASDRRLALETAENDGTERVEGAAGLPDSQENQHHGAHLLKPLTRGVRRVRAWVHRRPGGGQAWRIGVALLGLLVIVVGVVLLALPGPGWAVIFVGIGIWATEFAWARSLLTRVRHQVARWAGWIERQPRRHKIVAATTALLVLGGVALGAYLLAT